MRFRREKKRERGEFPPGFVESFMRQTLPTATPAEARRSVEHLRSKGWSEEELREKILPFMPRQPRPIPPGTISPPPHVSRVWLDQNLPRMERSDIERIVHELEGRGWPTMKIAMAVLPHLLPKLPREDADAIVAGMREIGMTDAEIAEVSRPR